MAKRKPKEGRPRFPSRPSQHRGLPSRGGGPERGRWLYGVHPVLAALGNPERRCLRLLVTAEAGRTLAGRLERLLAQRPGLGRETPSRGEIDRLLPGAVHQGLALEVEPLVEPTLETVLDRGAHKNDAVLVVLDQVTDPHNVGAVLRSAAAFGAIAVVATERHAPAATAALAKAASGALETTPFLRVTNLARALEEIKEGGFWCAGLAQDAAGSLAEARLEGRVALVLGAEGGGLRRLTRAHCDVLLRIPMATSAAASLNVSNAAAIALYELCRARR